MYGGKNLSSILQQHGEEPVEKIKHAILASLNGYRNDDDVTFVIIKRTN